MKYGSEGCMSNFYCNENQPAPNATIAILDRYCPVSNITLDDQFNYGIFLDSITNGYTGHINFAQKFIYSFWWGLRNIRCGYMHYFLESNFCSINNKFLSS